ncbi:MAG TPA: formylglycine-generating enzyme family protein [Anaerolineae bacterium]|nr:formylglycine-generating enzyme family protein [Anaerolineae bacterium]
MAPERLELVTFEFQVVAVNQRGEIVERRIERAQQVAQDLGNGVALEMVAIPGGDFRMGSRASEGYADEHPQHSVRVAPFLIGKYAVTQEQWAAIMDWTPPYRCWGLKRPADRVSWRDSQEFCQRLSARTGLAYRLPSEAEWEYACRAGATTPFYVGQTITTDLANYVGEHTFLEEPKGVYRHGTTDVGSFPPNAFGLHDMHGNVWEWCADAWHDDYVGAPADSHAWESRAGQYRVLRGGCWHDPPGLCRSAARLKQAPDQGEDFFGLRVALASLELDPASAIEPDRARPTTRITQRVQSWVRQHL